MAPLERVFWLVLGIFSALWPAGGEDASVNEMAISPTVIAAYFNEHVPPLWREVNVSEAAVAVEN